MNSFAGQDYSSRFGTLYSATVTRRYDLTAPESTKRVCHLTLKITGPLEEGAPVFSYKVGDSIGVFPKNPSAQVKEVLDHLKQGLKESRFDEDSLIHELLLKRSISSISKKWVRFALKYAKDQEGAKKLESLLNQPWDRTHIFPLWEMLTLCNPLPVDACIDHLSPLLPRYYSIASSPKKDPLSVDLVIGTFKTKTYLGDDCPGLCTQYLADHATDVVLFHHPSKRFTLPHDPNKDIILIGPGTGLAPYMGFLEEREIEHAPGKNWLFFGERNRKTDFYYCQRLENWEASGHVDLSLAFSRDQEEKVYVQDLLLKSASKVYQWIRNGCVIYVCGDAKRMAKDVHAALAQILVSEGQFEMAEAIKLLREMHLEGRYLQDVY
jgi:sulfite reductase (NADPH) flavoprotein alpha-component